MKFSSSLSNSINFCLICFDTVFGSFQVYDSYVFVLIHLLFCKKLYPNLMAWNSICYLMVSGDQKSKCRLRGSSLAVRCWLDLQSSQGLSCQRSASKLTYVTVGTIQSLILLLVWGCQFLTDCGFEAALSSFSCGLRNISAYFLKTHNQRRR